MSHLHRAISVVGLTFGLLFLAMGCEKQGNATAAQTRASSAAPVAVAVAQSRDVPVRIQAIARVEPLSTVTIRSRVAGELQKVHVTPGQDLKAGDLLFEIDPRVFEADLHQSQAQLDRDRAMAENARIDAERMAKLRQDNVATSEEANKKRYESEAANATVRDKEAALENAKLRLEYTKIRAPIEGRAGELMTHQGNVVKVDDTALLTINQIQPIYVTFAVPEQDLDLVRKHMQSGQPEIEVIVPPDEQSSERGKLSFVDNVVDSQTGTIRLKGTFGNESRRLWPGQFVQASLNLTLDRNAVVIPTRAIQTGQQGLFVFVVKEDKTVDMRPIQVRRTVGEESVIDSGIAPGEQVVIDGQLRLIPGAKVEIKQPPTTSPATQPREVAA